MRSVIFIAVIGLFLAANIYVAARIHQLVPGSWIVKSLVWVFFAMAIASMLLPFLLRDKLSVPLVGTLYIVGTAWMIIFFYLFLLVLFADIFRLINLAIPMVDKQTVYRIFHNNAVSTLVVFGLVAVTLFWGNWQYHNKKRVHLTIQSNKIEQPMRVVAISDLHLGFTIRQKEVAKWVKMINDEKPDLVLIGGDLLDNHAQSAFYYQLDKELQKLNAPLGIYACPGNHEYISGMDESINFFEKSGITLLRDSVAHVGSVSIIGRDDYSNKQRQRLSELTEKTEKGTFTLLLDHQPHDLNESVHENIDFHFSGHTHRGQVFPASLIADKIFELSHGYLQRGSTHFYVSSGLGIWGGKFRIGTRSDYLVLDLEKQ